MDSSHFGRSTDEKNEANLQPVRSHGGSTTTSPVWEYFKLNENNPIQATCLMCGTLMSRGGVSPSRCGTTNLRRHLSFAHGIVLPSKKKPQQAVIPISQQSESTVKRSLPLRPKQKKPLVPVPTEPHTSNEIPPYEICLRWKSYHVNMQTVFPSLLTNEHFVDVTLACEGRSIKCHRVILSACSSYFEDILCRTPCQHPIIIIKDLRFQELRALIDFMYQGEVYVPQERLPLLLTAAEALQIKGLSGPTSTNSQDEDVFPSTLKEEQKSFANSDFFDAKSKQKSSTAVREKYQNLPRTSRTLGGDKSSSKSRPNGIDNSTKLTTTSFGHYSHNKQRSAADQIHSKYASQDSDGSSDSFHPLRMPIKSELDDGDSSDDSFDHNLRLQRSQLQDVILTNDSICPAPICELSDDESVNTNGDGEDKTWSRYHGMQSTDDNSETEDIDRSSQGYMMVPEVVMDSGENSEGRES